MVWGMLKCRLASLAPRYVSKHCRLKDNIFSGFRSSCRRFPRLSQGVEHVCSTGSETSLFPLLWEERVRVRSDLD